MKKGTPIKCKIHRQGAVIISHAYMYQYGPRVCAIAVDMKTRWGKVDFESGGDNEGPGLGLVATRNSHPLKKNKKRSDITFITFPEFENWTIWSAQYCKDVLTVCIIKN